MTITLPTFRQFLEEKIELSKYRKIYNEIGQEYKERYKEWFGNKWRIVIPLSGSITEPVFQEVNDALSEADYEIVNWKDGIAKSKKSNRTQRIGRLLTSLKRPDLLKKFNERHKGKEKFEGDEQDLVVVISRHPYDIAGMSYDRSWFSCKHLDRGFNARFIPSEIDEGCLIAYATTIDDIKTLSKPISRLLIIPLFNENDPDDTILYVGDKFYGKSISGFKTVVEEWLVQHQGEHDILDYCLDPEKIYDDDYDELQRANVNLLESEFRRSDFHWYDVSVNDVDAEAKTKDITILDYIFIGYKASKYPNRVSRWFDSYQIREMISMSGYDAEKYNYNDDVQYMLKDHIDDDNKEVIIKLYTEHGGENEDWDDIVDELDEYIPETAERICSEYEELKTKSQIIAMQNAYKRNIQRTNLFTIEKDADSFYILASCYREDYDYMIRFLQDPSSDIYDFRLEDIEQESYDNYEPVNKYEFNEALRDYVL